MSAKRITRREALAASAAVVFTNAGVSGAPVPKVDPNASWIGKTVLPKKFATIAVPVDPSKPGTPPEDTPAGYSVDVASATVKSEKDDQLEFLLGDGTAVRLKRDEVVQLADAVDFFTKVLKEHETDVFALISRGWAHYLIGTPDKAIKDFSGFLELVAADEMTAFRLPARWEGLVNRGLVFAEQGEFKKALADLDEALKRWPGLGIAIVNRGYTFELMGEYEKAVEEYQKTSHLLAGNNIAWVLATCPQEMVRDGAEAVRIARIVSERTNNREGMYLDTLAAAYAETGKFDDAVKAQEKALEDKSYVIRYGEDGQKRLKLYKDKKPFRTEPLKK